MQIEAVIFDMDGVLVDSEPTWVAAEIDVFARHGVRLSPELCAQTRGMRVDAVARHWFERQPWRGAPVQTVADEVAAEVARRLRADPVALAGGRTAPHRVRELGLRCALASSSSMVIIEAVVHALDLGAAFESLHTAADHRYGKPHPAVYLAAAGALGVPAERCLAVEDSVTGLISARAASMQTVAIPDADRWQDPRFSIAHHRLRSLEELEALLRDA